MGDDLQKLGLFPASSSLPSPNTIRNSHLRSFYLLPSRSHFFLNLKTRQMWLTDCCAFFLDRNQFHVLICTSSLFDVFVFVLCYLEWDELAPQNPLRSNGLIVRWENKVSLFLLFSPVIRRHTDRRVGTNTTAPPSRFLPGFCFHASFFLVRRHCIR